MFFLGGYPSALVTTIFPELSECLAHSRHLINNCLVNYQFELSNYSRRLQTLFIHVFVFLCLLFNSLFCAKNLKIGLKKISFSLIWHMGWFCFPTSTQGEF